MILTYRYRLLPTKRLHQALAIICEARPQLYNAALEERVGCYRRTGEGRTYIDQCKALTVCRRELPEMAPLPVNLQRWTLKRLDEAFAGFFRRMKARDGRAGFPRFRGRGRWGSFGFNELCGIRWDGKRLRFSGMPGGLRVHLHRCLPDLADVRSCVFRRKPAPAKAGGRGWHVCFQAAIAAAEKRTVRAAIGIDLGLKVFAYCSDGRCSGRRGRERGAIARASARKHRFGSKLRHYHRLDAWVGL